MATNAVMDKQPPLLMPGRSVARQVAWLAGPVLIEQSLLYLVGLSDTVVTGRYLSAEHLAAVTVATYLMWALSSILTLVSVGATALVARRVGEKDWNAAARVCEQAMAMAMIVGTATLVLGWTAAPTIIRTLNLYDVAAESAVVFLRIVLAITPLLACTMVGVACLRGAGDTRTGMWVMVLVNSVNIATTWTFAPADSGPQSLRWAWQESRSEQPLAKGSEGLWSSLS